MSKGLEDIEIIRDKLVEYMNKAEGTDIKCLISPQFGQVRKELEALEIIKKFIWVEDSKLKCGRFGDIEIELDKSDFESKEEFELLKEVLGK